MWARKRHPEMEQTLTLLSHKRVVPVLSPVLRSIVNVDPGRHHVREPASQNHDAPPMEPVAGVDRRVFQKSAPLVASRCDVLPAFKVTEKTSMCTAWGPVRAYNFPW